jgi:hypothetical protein
VAGSSGYPRRDSATRQVCTSAGSRADNAGSACQVAKVEPRPVRRPPPLRRCRPELCSTCATYEIRRIVRGARVQTHWRCTELDAVVPRYSNRTTPTRQRCGDGYQHDRVEVKFGTQENLPSPWSPTRWLPMPEWRDPDELKELELRWSGVLDIELGHQEIGGDAGRALLAVVGGWR